MTRAKNGRYAKKIPFFHVKSVKMWSAIGSVLLASGGKILNADQWVINEINAPSRIEFLVEMHISDSVQIVSLKGDVASLRMRVKSDEDVLGIEDTLEWRRR